MLNHLRRSCLYSPWPTRLSVFGKASSSATCLHYCQPRKRYHGDVESRTEPSTLPHSDFMPFREYSGLLSLVPERLCELAWGIKASCHVPIVQLRTSITSASGWDRGDTVLTRKPWEPEWVLVYLGVWLPYLCTWRGYGYVGWGFTFVSASLLWKQVLVHSKR